MIFPLETASAQVSFLVNNSSQVSALISTTAGGVPRRCVVPPRIWTARYGGTRTSTDRPGCSVASQSNEVRTPLASKSRFVGFAIAISALPRASARSTFDMASLSRRYCQDQSSEVTYLIGYLTKGRHG